MSYKELYQPVHTIIGEGCIREIPRHIEAFGGTKALVVTDPGLLKIGTVKMVTDVLDSVSMPYAIYSDVKPNPTCAIVYAAKDVCQLPTAYRGGGL